ncbi:MAG TPA: hypothetical protein VHL80_16390 [Polyangia bacterium]|nr:hypothetical protein [Polyangia bacterium]
MTEHEAERLEERADAIRGDLGALVSELDRRRHRARKPLFIAASAGGLAAVAAGAFLLWRRGRRRRTRLQALAAALRRSVAHPERVATKSERSSLAKKVALSAAASVASVVARRAAQRLLGRPRTSGRT